MEKVFTDVEVSDKAFTTEVESIPPDNKDATSTSASFLKLTALLNFS